METHRDLEPEITGQEAIRATAATIVSFLSCHNSPSSSRRAQFGELDQAVRLVHRQRLLESVDDTAAYLEPMLLAMRLEGYYHMKTPCHLMTQRQQSDGCSDVVNHGEDECTVDCNLGSPWASMMQQKIIEQTLKNLLPVNIITAVKDEFHRSWYMVPWANPPAYVPKVHLHPSAPSLKNHELQVDSVTEAIYERPESIWDTGFFPNTALELRSKFNSPAAILQEALDGDTAKHYLSNQLVVNVTDIGRHLNAHAIAWALHHAPTRVRRRYRERGLPLVAGQDVVRHSGPAWIWNSLRLTHKQKKKKTTKSSMDGTAPCGNDNDYHEECLLVESQVLSTAVDHFIPYVRGKLYVKLLSPARALEWMYTDSLRRPRSHRDV